MIIEVNRTDGDARFQIPADAQPWKSLEVFRPDGGRIVNFKRASTFKDFGRAGIDPARRAPGAGG